MKKVFAIVLALLMLLSLAACGGDDNVEMNGTVVMTNPANTPEPTPESTPDAAVETTPEPTSDSAPETTPEPTPEATPDTAVLVDDAKSLAEGLIGEDISLLYDAIGQPSSSDYAPSCIGPGEDGNLYYDGFVVYTYREDGAERVEYVE